MEHEGTPGSELGARASLGQHAVRSLNLALRMTVELVVAVSRFPAPAKTSTLPTRENVRWADWAQVLARHQRWRDKDGTGWSPASYAPGTHRANEHVRAISCLVG